ncbi:RNA polymerase sigma factor [Taibaiella koreensis]|uniref:RNA polymerase sigma factor n=1 Tax=Taibaiella koreensis TaxID=1268548 RepID=UPI0013C2F831|nr:RNA polymerase sigma factor [Taibaiella koreensis]
MGKPAMQKEFYYAWYNTLMKVAIRYAGNREDAEQWVHDGFIKIFAHLKHFRNEGSFEGWIKKIMTRICIDQLRSSNALKFEVDNNTIYSNYELPTHEGFIDNEVLQKFSARDVLHLLNILPEKQKVVFNLHVFEGYNHKEIAEMLRITENHSYWLLHQARKTLRERCSNITSNQTSV